MRPKDFEANGEAENRENNNTEGRQDLDDEVGLRPELRNSTDLNQVPLKPGGPGVSSLLNHGEEIRFINDHFLARGTSVPGGVRN